MENEDYAREVESAAREEMWDLIHSAGSLRRAARALEYIAEISQERLRGRAKVMHALASEKRDLARKIGQNAGIEVKDGSTDLIGEAVNSLAKLGAPNRWGG